MYPFVIPLVICIMASVFILIYIPKRIARIEIYTTISLAVFMTQLIDMVFDVEMDLFGYGIKGADFWGILAELILNPAAAVVMMNFYPYMGHPLKKILYMTLCSILCLAFEWLFIQLGFYYHNGWEFWYSALSYPILIALLVGNITFTRRIV